MGRYPQVLGMSTENKIKRAVAFLADEAGIPRAKLAQAVVRFPPVCAPTNQASPPPLSY